VILSNGQLAGYVERGARSAITWSATESAVVSGMVDVAKRRKGTTSLATVNGESTLSSPLGSALLNAGFVTGYKGVTYRPPR
jgi:hypothetical protein